MKKAKKSSRKKQSSRKPEATHKLFIYGSQGSGDQKRAGRYPATGEVAKSECALVFIRCMYDNARGNPSHEPWCDAFHPQVLAALRRQGVDEPDYIRVECTTHLEHFEMEKINGHWEPPRQRE